MPTRTTVSAVFRAASGIPITRQVNMQSSLPVFYEGRGSDGRTPWLTVTDLSLIQDVKLSGRFTGQFVLNVLNLFDQSQITDVFRVETRANLPIGHLENVLRGLRYPAADHREQHPARSAVPAGQRVAGAARSAPRLQADVLSRTLDRKQAARRPRACGAFLFKSSLAQSEQSLQQIAQQFPVIRPSNWYQSFKFLGATYSSLGYFVPVRLRSIH